VGEELVDVDERFPIVQDGRDGVESCVLLIRQALERCYSLQRRVLVGEHAGNEASFGLVGGSQTSRSTGPPCAGGCRAATRGGQAYF
jgi:hypothetical protein